jgi:hypothetical protein
MKRYTTLLLILAVAGLLACGSNYVRTNSSGSSYNYSYDERDFNKYKWSAWQRSQWVQNHNGWILNVKKCTYHNRWNGHTFAMWSFDPKCESFYTAYQITPEMCHGENPKKFLWERGFRNIMYYEPANVDIEYLNPNVANFTREEKSFTTAGTVIGPRKIGVNKGTAIANAPEPLTPQEAAAKDREEKKRIMAMQDYDKKAAELNNYIVQINKATRLLNAYLAATNQTLTEEEAAYQAWLVNAMIATCRADVYDKTSWYRYEDGTIEHLQNYYCLHNLYSKFVFRFSIDLDGKNTEPNHLRQFCDEYWKKYHESEQAAKNK